jgi:hypothetical protein
MQASSEVVGCPCDRSPESDTASWNTSFSGQDQFSRSLKIMLATDVPQNSTKTSWRCSHFTAKHHGRRSASRQAQRSRSRRSR